MLCGREGHRETLLISVAIANLLPQKVPKVNPNIELINPAKIFLVGIFFVFKIAYPNKRKAMIILQP
jgi:hypothetical protein